MEGGISEGCYLSSKSQTGGWGGEECCREEKGPGVCGRATWLGTCCSVWLGVTVREQMTLRPEGPTLAWEPWKCLAGE